MLNMLLWVTSVILILAIRSQEAHPLLSEKLLDSYESKASCGFESCPATQPGQLNVHIISHTHDDVGWLKTVDQYYYGDRSSIQHAGVQYILDSIVVALIQDPTKRFIYVETSFFWQWWSEQDATVRDQFQFLVDSGRLEIISGAWSMNDEACTHYQSIIDQFTWGFRILNDTLGECARPNVGWQIDPFGHSREMASLLAQMGFEGLFFGRLDHQDKAVRLRDKTAEMIWQGSPDNLGASSDLFTHAMYNTYFSPPGFCFDVYCSDEPMIDNKRSPEYNIPSRVQEFLDFANAQAANYRTNHIPVTMGGDFHYQDAFNWFKNLDKLIKYVNELQVNGSNVNIFYSTPSCYLKAVNEANETWPMKNDDFFPYGSDDNSYWTGYFTSKPTIKYFERFGNNFLQVVKQSSALAGVDEESEAGITELRQAIGIMQHHDAITGTMKDHVANDYSRIISKAMQHAGIAEETAINTLLYSNATSPIPVLSCLKLNISECATSENLDSFVATIYNPLSSPVTQYVRLPVLGTSYSVRDPQGIELPVQLVPIHSSVLSLPGRTSAALYDLVFQATSVPALGLRSYYVTKLAQDGDLQVTAGSRADIFGNEQIQIMLDDAGKPTSLIMNGLNVSLEQSFAYYIGADAEGERASGAYIFRPNGTDAIDVGISSSTVYKGELVEEAHQVFGDGWISQVIRVYKEENHVEFEWMVGPIPREDRVGKEVINRFHTDLQTASTFYTDSNGRELMKRVKNFRPTWPVTVTEPIASNYYPVTSKILVRDETRRQEVAVLVDRSQGGSSLNDGQIELMLHRRLFKDDGFGVDEALNEMAYGTGLVARGRHYLLAGPLDGLSPSLAAQERLLAQRKLLNPWTFLTPTNGTSFQQWADSYVMEFSGLQQGLPLNVHVLTLEPWKDNRLLLRLEHILEKSEDPELSTTAIVNLEELFAHLTVISAEETTLGGNKWLDETKRMQWDPSTGNTQPEGKAVDLTSIALEPMQIRTFVVSVAPLLASIP